MDEKTSDLINKMEGELMEKIDELNKAINARFEHLKKVVADYLEAGSSMAMASVRANLKSV